MADKWIFRMRIIPFLFASFLPVAAIAQPSPNQAPERTWITDVRIISPEKLDHIEKGSVLIENGRIVRVERKTGAKKPAGATVVSGEEQFLIPGLIDSHVHLASIPGIRPEVNFGPAEAKPTWIKKYFKQLPRSYLYFGYTTLVDLAVVDRLVLDDFRQAPLHPDCMTAGSLCLLPMDIRCRLRRLKHDSNCFPILSTTLTKPPAFPLNTRCETTLPPQR
jgi:hypothetical protein